MRKILMTAGVVSGAMFTASKAEATCHVKENIYGEKVAYFDEHYRSASKRTYVMKGKRYRPLSTAEGYAAEGHASWYGKPFHGRKTANGEEYNMYDYTAAHPTLPIPSCVRVTNVENGKSVIVRINDRGPFKSDLGTDTSKRVIDLSMKAALELDFRHKGITNVKLEAIPVEQVMSASN